MKKLLTSALAFAMSVTCAFGLAACGDEGMTDAEIANSAINNLRMLYKSDEETPRDYQVLGKTRVQDNLYDVEWTVSAENNDVSDYVSVGEEMDEEYLITISVTRPPEAMEYKLNASVSVGEATASYSFTKKLPAAAQVDTGNRETTDASITFDAACANRTEFTTEIQVWEQNGVKVTGLKGSGSDIVNYGNPARFYKGSIVKIEYPGMKHLEIDSVTFDDNDYAGAIKTSIENANIPATVTVTDGDVAIDLNYAMDCIEFTASAQLRMYALDIVAVVGGAWDADKVAVAKATASIAQTTFSELGQLDLPTESYGASFTWSVKETTDLVSIADGKLSIDKLPEEDTRVTLVAAIVCGEESDAAEVVITLRPDLGLTNDGTIDHPFTTTEARALAGTLDADSYYQKDGEPYRVYVKGYVTKADGFNSSYSNWTGMYIASDVNGTDEMQVYRFAVDGTVIKSQSDLVVGSYIVVYGYLQNYKGNNYQVTYSGSTNPIAVDYQKVEVDPNAHVCEHVCPQCNKCLSDCEEPECATKCPGHDYGDNSQSNPYTVVEALAIANGLGSGAYSATEVYVAGYVVKTGTWNSDYSNYTNVYIADTPVATTSLQVYRLIGDSFTTGNEIELGAHIVIYGYLQNYQGNTPEMTYNGTTPTAVEYAAATDEIKVDLAIADLVERFVVANAGETTLPTTKISGVALAWVVKEGDAATVTANGLALNVEALPAANATVVLEVTVSCGEASQTKEVTVTVKAPLLDAQEISLDMAFAQIGDTDWNSSYGERTVKFEQAGVSDVTGSVVMSNANKQTGTITDIPVICAKNTAQYVTLVTDANVSAVEFVLTQWGSKTFADIHIEYSTDGSVWTSCSDKITTPATIASNAAIPEGATVRLSFVASNSNNTQMGLQAINLTIA